MTHSPHYPTAHFLTPSLICFCVCACSLLFWGHHMQMLLLYWSPWTCLYCFVGLKCEYEMLSSGEVSPIHTLPSCSPNFPYLLGEAPCFSHDNQNVVIWGECCHGIKQAHSNSDGKIKKKPLNRWSGAVLCCPSCSRGLWKGRAEHTHTHTHTLWAGFRLCAVLLPGWEVSCCLLPYYSSWSSSCTHNRLDFQNALCKFQIFKISNHY